MTGESILSKSPEQGPPDYEVAWAILSEEFKTLGIKFTATPIPSRDDLGFSDKKWNKRACHARCLFTFANGTSYSCEYSAGIGAAFGKLSLAEFRKLARKPGLFGDSWQVEDAYKHIKGRHSLTVAGEEILNAARLRWTPNPLDVFASLLADATLESFEDFCSEFGYDTDSRRAEKIWNTCREVDRVLRSALGSAKLDELRELAWQL